MWVACRADLVCESSAALQSMQLTSQAYLIVDVSVTLSPGKVVFQTLLTWVAHCAAIKDRQGLSFQIREESFPAVNKSCCESGHHNGQQL